MAKRKSTDKSSKTDPEDKVEAAELSDALDAAATDTDTPTDTGDVSDAVPDDGPKNETADATDDTPELSDIKDDTDVDAVSDLSEPDGVTSQKTPDGDDTVPESSEVAATDDDTILDEADTVASADGTDAEHISEEEAEQLIEEAETGDPSTDPVDVADSAAETPSNAADTPPAQPEVIRETVVEKKGGFVPMVLGGVIAAALGYGGAAYVSQSVWPFASAEDNAFETEMRDTLSAQSGSLAEVAERVTALEGIEPPSVDLSPIQSDIAAIQETAAGITAQLDEIAARVEALEKRPLEQAVSPEAIAAYENALADLQAEVEAQRAEVVRMAEEALAAEDNAEEQAQLAAARAALADLTTALDTGAEYTEAVGILASNGVDVPDALASHAETGIATQGALIEAFPAAARAALSAARSDATQSAEGASRVATFFANQLGARSVAPRDGDDPDAVLSRAEASVRAGDLSAALSELAALPEIAQAAVAEWQASASTRLEAKSAAGALVQQLLQE